MLIKNQHNQCSLKTNTSATSYETKRLKNKSQKTSLIQKQMNTIACSFKSKIDSKNQSFAFF